MTPTAVPFLLPRRSGFTLLDLLMAMGIFVILAVIAIPNWVAQLPTYRLNSAARQIQSDLHRIKSQAVARHAAFQVVFLTPSLYRIEKTVAAIGEGTIQSKSLPDGITYGTATTVELISFTARGTSNGGTVQLCNNRREGKSIVVLSSTGRIRIMSGAC